MKTLLQATLLATITFISSISHAVTMNLEEAINHALRQNHQIKQLQHQRQALKNQKKAAQSGLLPALSVNASYTHYSDIEPFSIQIPLPGWQPFELMPNIPNQYGMRLTLSQPLFTGFRLISSIKRADYAYQAMDAQSLLMEKELIYQIRKSWWQTQYLIQVCKLTEKSMNMLETHAQQMKNYHQQGLITLAEVLNVEVEWHSLRLTLTQNRHRRELSELMVKNLLAMNPDTPLIMSDTIPELWEKRDDPELKDAWVHHLQLERLRWEKAMEQTQVTTAKADFFPRIMLMANWTQARPNQRFFPLSDEWNNYWDVGVVFSWDIWNWGRDCYRTNAAKESVAARDEAISQTTANLKMEWARINQQLRENEERLVLTAQSLEAAETHYQEWKHQFDSGILLNSRLLEAETALYRCRVERADARIAYQLSLAERDRFLAGYSDERH